MPSPAFSLIELLMVIAIIALLVSILFPGLAAARRAARAVVCQSNMRQMMVGHATYQSDFKNYIAALNSPGGDVPRSDSAVAQVAREILFRTTGRRTGATAIPSFINGSNRTFVLEQFSCLALVDQLGGQMPMPATVCPEDAPRLVWRADPLRVAKSAYALVKNENKINSAWWPFSSSYQLIPAACVQPPSTDPAHNHVYAQDAQHDRYIIDRTKTWEMEFGGRTIDEVTFPSMKVTLYDTQRRHYGKYDLFFGYKDCRQPLAFFDGSVSVRSTGDANIGWNPNSPAATNAKSFRYLPDSAFESPVPEGRSDEVYGYYRWTRSGLGGIDFGGSEVFTQKKAGG